MKQRFHAALSRLTIAALLALAPQATSAQAPGVPIEAPSPAGREKALIKRAAALRDTGRLLPAKAIAEQLKTPQPAPIHLVQAHAQPMRTREVAERARLGSVRVGWFYLCARCRKWHLDLSDGYAIATNAVATCHHCVEPESTMREGWFIAVDSTGTVLPVTGVLARNKTLDAALLRVSGGSLAPLPLSTDVAPGDAAYCYSDPLRQMGYLSAGIVNRFYWLRGRRGAAGSLDELKFLRLNVSTDWAPGSSGAAVLDERGNVIGHVATIAPLTETAPRAPAVTPPEETPVSNAEEPEEKPVETPGKPRRRRQVPRDRFNGAVLITLHEAVPACGILALAGALTNSAATPNRPGGVAFPR